MLPNGAPPLREATAGKQGFGTFFLIIMARASFSAASPCYVRAMRSPNLRKTAV
jgi:hypothetical protein